MDRKKFINLLSEEIVNTLSSDSIITVVDLQNFFVVKGKTSSEKVINVKDVYSKLCSKYNEYKNINFNIIDLIEYSSKPYQDKVVEISINPEDIFKIDNDILISDFQYSRSRDLGKSIYYYCKMIFDICQSYFRMSRIKFWFEHSSENNSYKLISIRTDSYYNDNKLISIILDNFDFDLTNFYERLSIIENLDTYNWSLEKENLMLEVI
jgi:hypothetical protein